MDVARNLARSGSGVALRSNRTRITIALRTTVKERASVVYGAAGVKQFAIRANVDPTLLVPPEVRAREDAVLPITLLPNRNVRGDFLLLDQPAQKLARPLGCVGSEPLRLRSNIV